MAAKSAGVVYLIHFDRPYKHARHYLGFTNDLAARMDEHGSGRGARLMAVITEAGIGWELARTWTGSRGRERQLKRQGGASRACPCCGVRPRGSRFAGGGDGRIRSGRDANPGQVSAAEGARV
ncbi:hypothetical protein OG921_26295 [Aldersonia sp. NBC_00410]|uniref:hypothetical protein n=1 Tax=Aldersonia sp. NBC_00410 TaxID=2975954 RepID=UPI00224E57E2|nr:hypothetical protein [Aldersonia sp. NBC_00410]MCX5046690.1 hypothetical protein [Aldersonia sp. NBC_00410]